MVITAIPGTVATWHAPRANAARADDEIRERPADALNEELRTQRESSLAWQIVERSFSHAEDGEQAARVEPRAVPQRTSPITRTAQASSGAAEVEYFAAEAHITEVHIGPDGVRIIQADLTYERLAIRRTAEPVQKSDPLALDLDGDGVETTGVDAGMRFDLNADGRADRASVVTSGDAFLALDGNHNGRIDDGRELFGDQTGYANGFEALRAHDDNGDARIDTLDSAYAELALLDWNADGSQRLRSLAEAGIASIALDYATAAVALNAHDGVAQTGSYTRSDGSSGTAADLLLGFSALA